jgi:F-type H+-transporting ATPase subunit a
MQISPDNAVLWQWGFLTLNKTLVFTWLVMALLVIVSILVTRRLTTDISLSKGQNLLESIVIGMLRQIEGVHGRQPERLLPFLGTLFLFIALSNLLSVVPGFDPPTGSLSTTAALALCVFLAVPFYAIQQRGPGRYLKNYMRPNPLMLPFNIMGELSRTLALAVRLFGNVMSGSMIAAILLSIAPLVFPVVMQLFGLLTGLVQAYIFAILAAVYIAAGLEVEKTKQEQK